MRSCLSSFARLGCRYSYSSQVCSLFPLAVRARVEGATPWEDFWVITFPIVSPLILTNVVYTVIDSFTAYNNGIISMIRAARVGGAGYGVSAAMSWIYFALIAVLLVTVVGIISKKVFYME